MPRKTDEQVTDEPEVEEAEDSEVEQEEQSSNSENVAVGEERRGRVIKYMGSADIRHLPVGETLLFRTQPLKQEIRWNANQGHVIHTADYPQVSEEFWNHLLNFTDFQDVSEEYHSGKGVPKGTWEKIWRLSPPETEEETTEPENQE